MRIFPRLALGFGVVVAMLAVTGALVVSNLTVLRATSDHVKDRVSFNEGALEYRHGAETATLGAAQLASGSPMGDQRIREGTATMARSRERLKARATGTEAVELGEIERLERLTIGATTRVETHVHSKSPNALVQQDLAFLSARSDALSLRLEALADDTREETRASMATADQIGSRVKSQTFGAILACILFSMFVAVYVSRSIAGPVGHLAEGVRRIREGELSHAIAVTSADEIGQLTTAFNGMTNGLREAMAALDGRNRDMRLVFDNVAQGLVTMNPDGTVSDERSAVVDSWIGPIPKGCALWTHFEPLDHRFAANFKLAYESLFEDDWMPLELRLDNTPKKARVGDRFLELELRPILDGEKLAKVLVIVSDVSERVAQEKARSEEQETLAVFQAIQRDKQGFLDFFSEGKRLVGSLFEESPDLVTLKRQIHTIKGNSGLFSIGSMVGACHELETTMEDEQRAPTVVELEHLRARWRHVEALVGRLVGDGPGRIEIEEEEHKAILDALVDGIPRTEVARMVAQLKDERASVRLTRFGEQARALAARLGKSNVDIVLDCGALRFPRGDTLAPFWSAFVHVVRNAVDHGLDSVEQRQARGQTDSPALTFAARTFDDELSIEIADNGRGIAWEAIASKARERGLPSDTREDLVRALFSDGVSTADSVTEVSGRGVGMSAVREACEKLGGHISIASEPGLGTRMAFRFPSRVLGGSPSRAPTRESGTHATGLPTTEAVASIAS